MRKKTAKRVRHRNPSRVRRKPGGAPAVSTAAKAKVRPREIMLSFFDRSTVMARPWAEAGYLTYCIDLQHPRGEHPDPENENIVRVGAHIEDWLPPVEHEAVFAAFFPPCTDVAVSGGRWLRDKGVGALYRAIGLFHRSQQLAELLRCPYLIENPVSTISTYWRRPDYTFHPNEYGDPYLKRTCLWVGGGFVMPPQAPVKPTEGMKLYWLPPSKDRANLRSVTPPGFAKATFEANDPATRAREQRQRVEEWQQAIKSCWNNECALTGIRIKELVVANHIVHNFEDRKQAQEMNGITLAPHISVLFDHGLISFEDDGRLLVSPRLSEEDFRRLSLPGKLRRPPTGHEMALLRQHRESVFFWT
jgi:hypothetical protein